MWVRGLKHIRRQRYSKKARSHPMWVRGLKHLKIHILSGYKRSHPMWVRGLKHASLQQWFCTVCRTLCGCVDWNCDFKSAIPFCKVAPYVGAWIETSGKITKNIWYRSHPMWVRGLKPWRTGIFCCHSCRTLCGCVDWNSGCILHAASYILSHPMWVRGLKLQNVRCTGGLPLSHPMWVRGLKLLHICIIGCHGSRTLCGCVDWNNSSF